MAAHQHHLEHRVVEREMGFLRHDRDPPRRFPPRELIERPLAEQHAARRRPPRAAQQTQQRRLAGAVRAEDAAERTIVRRTVTTVHDQRRARRIPERNVIGPQQRGLPRRRCGPATDNPALPRSPDRTDSAPARRPRARSTGSHAAEIDDGVAGRFRRARRSARTRAPRRVSCRASAISRNTVTRSARPRRVERSRVARPAEQRVADGVRRGRLRRAVHREDLRIEERVGGAHAEAAWPRHARPAPPARTRVRHVVGAITADVRERPPPR